MKVLLIGSGAREHALARALCRSRHSVQLSCYASSHNPGIRSLTENYQIGDLTAIQAIAEFAQQEQADFVVIGPEAPLENGLADALWKINIPVIGPRQQLARIETSKSFARDLMQKYHIPGLPKYQVFETMTGVAEYLGNFSKDGYVIKANGLMGGKGVKVAGEHLHSMDQALTFCQQIVDQHQSFIIEEKFIGQEFSFMAFCDGIQIVAMPCVQDHKRAFVGDTGPNTGGMGSYSNADHSLPFLMSSDLQAAHAINQAVFSALQQECGEKYIGILYGSFIATSDGVSVIEFNARFGDPEVMNVLAVLETDFVDVCQAMIQGNLSDAKVKFAHRATVCKYVVPAGYPDNGMKDALIDISKVAHPEQLYFASINSHDGKLLTGGSRAIAVVGIAETLVEAEALAEKTVSQIHGPVFHRRDIGTAELLERRMQQMQTLRAI